MSNQTGGTRGRVNNQPNAEENHQNDEEPRPASSAALRNNQRASRGRSAPRGRRQQQPRAPRTARPDNEPPPPPTAPVPKPQHLSKTSSKLQNDPLHQAAFFPSPGNEMSTIARNNYLHTAADAMMDIVTMEYRHFSAKNFNVKRNIPESAYAYYAAVLVYARMLDLQHANIGGKNFDEGELVIEAKKFRPPKLLGTYLSGFGNTDYTDGAVEEKFAMLKPTVYVDEQGVYLPGYFGRITQNPQKYAQYPCIAVFAQRIQQDLTATAQNEYNVPWTLPAIYDNVVLTEACLGYKRATTLDSSQVSTLGLAGVHHNEFEYTNDSFAFNKKLMDSVQAWIDEIKDIKTIPFPELMSGTKGQVVLTTLQNGPIKIPQAIWIAYAADQLPGPIDYGGATFRYRTYKTIETRDNASLRKKKAFMPYAIQNHDQYQQDLLTELYNADTNAKLKVRNVQSATYSVPSRLETLYTLDFA